MILARFANNLLARSVVSPEKRPVLWTRDFVFICINNLLTFMSFQMLLTTLPVYVQSLGGGTTFIGLITGIFTVSSIVMRPFSGQWLDKYGRKGLWIIGSIGFIGAVAGYNWAVTIPLLIVLRIFHGAVFSIVTNASAAGAADLTPKARMGEGMGFFGLGTNIGMGIGPAIGFYLFNIFGFPAIFGGSALFALGALLTIKLIRLPQHQGTTSRPQPFAIWEPEAFRPSSLQFFPSFILGGVIAFVAIYGTEIGINNAGLFFTVYAFTVVLTRPVAGMVFDRLGHRQLITGGFISFCAGMITLSQAGSLQVFLTAAVLTAIGFGLIHPALQALAVNNCPPDKRASAQATFMAFFDLGVGAGAISLGFLAQFTGYSGIYLAEALVALIGLIAYMSVYPKKQKTVAGSQKAE